MIPLITGLLTAAVNIGDKLIEDKDKKTEFAFKMAELAQRQMETLLNQPSYKWIDGLVKLSYASEQIIKGLIRPVGSLIMAGFGAYCAMQGIELSDTVQTLLFGAPVAWGVSRHVEKKQS